MEQKKNEILRIINNCSIAYTVSIMIFVLFGPLPREVMVENLMVVGLVLVCEWMDRHFPNLVVFTAAHVVLFVVYISAALFFFRHTIPGIEIPENAYDITLLVIRVIIGIVCTVASYYLRMGENRFFYPHFGFFALYIIFYAVGRYKGDRVMMSFAVFMESFCAIITILYNNYNTLFLTMRSFSEKSAIPTGRIRRTNRMELWVFTAASAVLIAIGALFNAGGLLVTALRSGILAVLRAIVSFLSLFDTAEPEAVEEIIPEEAAPGGFGGMPPGKENLFIQMIWNILGYVLAIVVFALIGYLIVRGIIAFYREFNRTGVHRDGADKSEFLDPREHREKTERGSDTANDAPGFLDRSPDARIRRAYKRFIESHRGRAEVQEEAVSHIGQPGYYSDPKNRRRTARRRPEPMEIRESWAPLDIEDNVLGKRERAAEGSSAAPAYTQSGRDEASAQTGQGKTSAQTGRGEALALIHRLYEKARYMPGECTAEDAAAMQEAVKQYG